MANTKSVLVHLGSGMGNILLATPMIEMLAKGEFYVDLCLQGQTPEVDTLFKRWQCIRTVSTSQSPFLEKKYDVYIYGFEVKGEPIKFSNFKNAIILHPMWDWNTSHELYSEIELYTNLARSLVPEVSTIYQPTCIPSDRVFSNISENTCVLVPGGEKQLIIRKWPWYDKLAEKLPNVAIVGLPSDLDNTNRIVFPKWINKIMGKTLSYQGRLWKMARRFSKRYDFELQIPKHTKNYIGKLSLEDTAALIKQAGIVIANDCGIAHMAAALGKPVFLIIGPTSSKKNFPDFLSNITIIRKNFDCQPCQEKQYLGVCKESSSQCFCPYGIRCMEEITPDEVIKIVEASLNEKIT